MKFKFLNGGSWAGKYVIRQRECDMTLTLSGVIETVPCELSFDYIYTWEIGRRETFECFDLRVLPSALWEFAQMMGSYEKYLCEKRIHIIKL